MKKLILLSILLMASTTFAKKKLKLNDIGFGKSLFIEGKIQLPKGQRLNPGAPSKIEVYEKGAGEWVITDSVSLNTYAASQSFQMPVKLKSDRSEIMIKASLYHCNDKHQMCVIDDYEGAVHRDDTKASSELAVDLRGSDPKF